MNSTGNTEFFNLVLPNLNYETNELGLSYIYKYSIGYPNGKTMSQGVSERNFLSNKHYRDACISGSLTRSKNIDNLGRRPRFVS